MAMASTPRQDGSGIHDCWVDFHYYIPTRTGRRPATDKNKPWRNTDVFGARRRAEAFVDFLLKQDNTMTQRIRHDAGHQCFYVEYTRRYAKAGT